MFKTMFKSNGNFFKTKLYAIKISRYEHSITLDEYITTFTLKYNSRHTI